MTVKPPTPEEMQRCQAEVQQLRAAVADVTLAWAEVENVLVRVLTAVFDRDDLSLPSAIYFSATSLDGRLAIVDSAFRWLFRNHAAEKRVMDVWDRARSKFKNLKKVRNNVAHGQIVIEGRIQVEATKYYPRLTAPAFDFETRRRAKAGGQLPGMSANDLRQSAGAVVEFSKALDRFEFLVRAFNAGNETDFQNILAESSDT
jgi:hypothetical protein